MYDADVFEVVEALKPSGRGEIEITDVNNAYIDRGKMEYDVIDGFWGDAGESIDVYYEVIDFVRANGVNKTAKSKTAARREWPDARPGHGRRRLYRQQLRALPARDSTPTIGSRCWTS